MQISSHGEMRTSTAGRAGGRANHEQPGDREHVDQHDVLQPEAVRRLEDEERRHEEHDARPRHAVERERRDRQRGRASAPRGRSSPRATGRRASPVEPSCSASRTSLTRYAALDAAQYAANTAAGLDPPRRVAELLREQDPGEEEQVLRPLARAQRGKRPRRRSAAPKRAKPRRRIRRLRLGRCNYSAARARTSSPTPHFGPRG